MTEVAGEVVARKPQGVLVEGRASNINLNHDPDKPLAAHIPFMKMTDLETFRVIREGVPKNSAPAVMHTNWWTKDDTMGGHDNSQTMTTVHLTTKKTKETLDVPCQVGTTCFELALMLAHKTSIHPCDIEFISKSGCSFRKMYPSDQVRPKMACTLEAFKKMPMKYPHPIAVIGAGHVGLKTAMICMKKDMNDFIVIDRMKRVGGTSWLYQANTTSKLQTEYGAYHLEFDEENPVPSMFTSPWPSRNMLLNHFESVAIEYGIMPHVKLQTNVKSMEMFDKEGQKMKNYHNSKWNTVGRYELTFQDMAGGYLTHGKFVAKPNAGVEDTYFDCSVIAFYPGNLTIPREETYKNEETFEGEIGYGMFDEVDYSCLPGKNVVVVGHGAFAVENVRTCCEFGCGKAFLVCRRKNIACPRVVSWLANRSLVPLTCVEFLDHMKPMYDLLGWDPWTYYAVSANEKRTTCMIQQKARFGIGDIYFLSQYMGKMEVVIDTGGIKKVSKCAVHMASGRKLDNVRVILKLLGFVGELENDRLMKMKELEGFWCDGDPLRYLVAEPVSVSASNMGGTSLSPGALNWSKQFAYFVNWPRELVDGASAAGLLPKHGQDFSDPDSLRPAYVVDARHGTSTGMAVMIHAPGLAEDCEFDGYIKAVKHRICHPVTKFLAAAKEDWDYYAQKFLKEGFGTDIPYPTYPYDVEFSKSLIFSHMTNCREPLLPCDHEDLGV